MLFLNFFFAIKDLCYQTRQEHLSVNDAVVDNARNLLILVTAGIEMAHQCMCLNMCSAGGVLESHGTSGWRK